MNSETKEKEKEKKDERTTVVDPIVNELEIFIRHAKGLLVSLKKIRIEAKKFPGSFKF